MTASPDTIESDVINLSKDLKWFLYYVFVIGLIQILAVIVYAIVGSATPVWAILLGVVAMDIHRMTFLNSKDKN